MCGISGLFGSFDLAVLRRMASALRHRGPEHEGYYENAASGVALGHTRLSIIDLECGQQPIYNEDRSVVLVFNGEIYNYIELREELEKQGHKFATRSDTETIVHLYEEYGEQFPDKLNGCFAIALYDIARKKLFLVRDRLGIRPIYYVENSDGLIFASEPKAIFASGLLRKCLNHEALSDFLRLRYTPGPRTLFEGVMKLPPGHIAVWDVSSPSATRGKLCRTIRPWWDIDQIEAKNYSDAECIDRFDELLNDAVRLRMRSDVPVSAFLSGGIDSSLIVRLMAKHGNVHKTYSIGFGLEIDEIDAARRFAEELGIRHEKLYVPRDGYRDLARVVGRMDDPVGDVIVLPTHMLAEGVAREAKVAMTGEGADEIWGGYLHHFVLHYLMRAQRGLPGSPRALAALVRALPLGLLSAIFPYPAALGHKGKAKLCHLLERAEDTREAYLTFVMFAADERVSALLGGAPVTRPPVFDGMTGDDKTLLQKILAVERRSWLPDYTLLKQDTLAMANSLEGRVPFLDHRIVEFAASIGDRQKIRNFQTKYLLRKVAERHVGSELAWRKKKAFYIPTERAFDDGFQKIYRDYFEDSLVCRHGVFDPKVFAETVSAGGAEILDNKLRNTLLIFQIWYQEQFAPS